MNLSDLYQSIRPRYEELRGKVAIITGSSRGIGKGLALRLAREGMKVVLNGRSPEPVQELATALSGLGAEVLPVPADIGQTEGIERLFAETLAAFGGVDLMVNNAAFMAFGQAQKVTEERLDEAWRINARGAFFCSQRAAQAMIDNGTGGNIVNISSVGGLRAHWRGTAYDMMKGALDSMTRAMALDLSPHGIRVNAVAPGAIMTEGRPPEDDERMQAVARRIPLGRFGQPLDIAAMVAFLASDEASYLTGQVLYVDGGITAQLTPLEASI